LSALVAQGLSTHPMAKDHLTIDLTILVFGGQGKCMKDHPIFVAFASIQAVL